MSTPPLILALETSSRWGSLALGRDGRVLAQKGFSGPLRHSIELFPTLKNLLEEISAGPGDISTVALSIGPGSFTGLRIAVALAKSMALASGCKLIPVSSLDVVVANLQTAPGPLPCMVTPIVDAKRGQFFMAAYRWDTDTERFPERILEDSLKTPGELKSFREAARLPACLLGEGLVYHADKFAGADIHILGQDLWQPRAAQVYHLAEERARAGLFADPLALKPAYLREALVTPKGGRSTSP
jgi:tRNA threonylcarbamoyladenosine biosynthesis protein TsaB